MVKYNHLKQTESKFLKNITKILVFFSTIVFAVAVLAVVSIAAGTDLSRPGSQNNKTATAGDILSAALGESICEEEHIYLSKYADSFITYDDGITSNYIKINYIKESGTLSVYAKPYTYTSVSEALVTWTPSTATLGETTLALTEFPDGTYTAEFSSVPEVEETEAVSVLYEAEFSVPEEELSRLATLAYTNAPKIKSEFEKKKADYLSAKADYESYLAASQKYQEDKRLYEEYLTEKLIYDEAKKEYNEYLSALAEYTAALERYEKYTAALAQYEKEYSVYAEYLSAEKLYQKELAAYNEYVERSAIARAQLNIMDFSNIKMHYDKTEATRSAKLFIVGKFATGVLNERDSLENVAGVPPAVIDLAGNATERLRVLLTDYFSLETEAARYAYYAEYYDDFKNNFVDLFISLDFLYANTTVQSYVYKQNKDAQYRLFLAQLCLIATAISDEPVKSVDPALVVGGHNADKYRQHTYNRATYKTADGYRISEIITEHYLDDTDNAAPVFSGFPEEVKEPIPPQTVSQPERPEYVPYPEIPEAAADPGEGPAPVSDPGEAPVSVASPGAEPTLTEAEAGVVSAYENGLIPDRSSMNFLGGYTYKTSKIATKLYGNGLSEVTVSFYSDADRGELLYETTVDKGSLVDFDGRVPKKAEDDRATYVFVGWQDAEGHAVDLSSIQSSIFLFPRFDDIIKSYTVTWDIDGVVTKESFLYGTVPSYKGLPERKESDTQRYSFSGWDKELTAVVSDATYKAKFTPSYIVPATGGGARIYEQEGRLVVDFTSFYDSSFPLSEILKRASGKIGVKILSRFAEIELSALAIRDFSVAGADKLSFKSTKELGKLSCRISVFNADGDEILTSSKMSLRIPSDLQASERLRLSYILNDNTRYSAYEIGSGHLSFEAVSGRDYVIASEYNIVASSIETVKMSVEGSVFSAGESVGINVQIQPGYRMSRLYYIDSDGNKTELTKTRFLMPQSDITLVCEAEPIEYRITFVSDGKVISEKNCPQGQIPVPPESPKKAPDGDKIYTFSHWSPQIVEAAESMTYVAVFTEETVAEEPAEVEYTVFQKAVMIGMGAAALVLIVVLVTVGIVITKRRYG